jgi:hypothetical protein
VPPARATTGLIERMKESQKEIFKKTPLSEGGGKNNTARYAMLVSSISLLVNYPFPVSADYSESVKLLPGTGLAANALHSWDVHWGQRVALRGTVEQQ